MPAVPFIKRLAYLTPFALSLALASPVFAAPSLKLTSPQSSQKVESDKVTVSWELTDFTLVDYAQYTTPKAGQGHIHLWLDESEPTAANSIKAISGSSYTFEGVSSGPHTLVVELQNNNHTPLKPPVKTTVNFETTTPVYLNPQLPQNDLTLFMILVAIVLVGGLWYFLSPESKPHYTKPVSKSRSRRRK